MAGYAVTGRIAGAQPRFVGTGANGRVTDAQDGRDADRHVADDRPLAERLSTWWEAAREEFAQATFFLFDPESWR